MPPRVVTISDHVDCPTGFGVQHRHLAAALAQAGYDVHSLGLWDTRPLAAVPAESGLTAPAQSAFGNRKSEILFTRYPGGLGAEDHRRAWAMYRDLLRPDLVITLGNLETFAHLNDDANGPGRPFAWAHWLPLDALPYPTRDHERMLRYDHLVLMSRFALEVVRPHLEGRVPLHYIPHAVDTRTFRPLDDPLALRRRWSRRLGVHLRPADFILIARDANQWRKQQPLLLDALAQTPSGVKLLFHCHPAAHTDANGWDLLHLARDVYGVADRVVFTTPPPLPPSPASPFPRAPALPLRPAPCPPLPSGEGWGEGPGARHAPGSAASPATHRAVLTPAELAELDNLADLRVSATQGEGFGVLTIEAMACGTPTLITDYTTSRELLLGIPDCRLPISDFAQRPPAGVARATPQRRFAPSSVILPVPEHDGNQAVAHLPPAVRVESNPADPQARAPVLHPLRAIGNRKSEIGDTLDPFGPAGELVRVASWTVEQRRHLLRPIIDTADLAARIVALRDSPDRLARYAEAGLRRVHAAYTVEHMARAWLDLVHSILG